MGYGNFRGSGGSGGFGGRRPGGFRRNNNFKREMTKIKCSQCGKEDEVPFKPREGSNVLCKECYMKSKGIEPRNSFSKEAKPKEASEESEEAGDSFEESSDSEEEL